MARQSARRGTGRETTTRVLLCLILAFLLVAPPALAQQGHGEPAPRTGRGEHDAPPDRPRPPPPDAVTHHVLDLPGRTLHLTATAGFVRVLSEDGAPEADIGTTAFTLDGADPATRPVTFVLNGGPGNASAWLDVGNLGPWRIALVPGASSPAVPRPNADTWLDFTDLVFVDPVGTGYSRFVPPVSDEARKRLWSVGGDVDALSQAIRRWLDAAGRITANKYLVGESYGGFRAPLLARRLAEHDGVGLRGLVMISPVLDFGNRSGALDVLGYALRLPTMAAVVRSEKGEPFARADLADVESYATGPFITDVLRGYADPAAVDRTVERVSAITGLDPSLVRRHRGLVSGSLFEREHDRAAGRIDSAYDATVSLPDAYPEDPERGQPDPTLGTLEAPVTGAMLAVYDRLHWRPEGPTYRLYASEVGRQWDFGRNRPQALGALRLALASDPALHVLIGQGLFDLVTPFEGTQVLLNQIAPAAGADRVRLATFPGGHMFYSRDASRAAFRAEAETLIDGAQPP